MYDILKKILAFLLPILRQAALETFDEIVDDLLAESKKPPRRRAGYTKYNRMSNFDADEYAKSAAAVRKHFRQQEEPKEGFHDVLMVAFDISGPNAEIVHDWLQKRMPTADEYRIGYTQGSKIVLDSWWVANDERFDESDTDSAVFVSKGLQEEARRVLRAAGLVD